MRSNKNIHQFYVTLLSKETINEIANQQSICAVQAGCTYNESYIIPTSGYEEVDLYIWSRHFLIIDPPVLLPERCHKNACNLGIKKFSQRQHSLGLENVQHGAKAQSYRTIQLSHDP
jgi:hypothetical protein